MAQPHKGHRHLVGTRLTRDVHEEVKRRARGLDVSVSQYVADIVAAHVGHADEVRELPADVLFSRYQLEGAPLDEIA